MRLGGLTLQGHLACTRRAVFAQWRMAAYSVVASDGLEPSRSNRAADFKSAVSTNSTTRPPQNGGCIARFGVMEELFEPLGFSKNGKQYRYE